MRVLVACEMSGRVRDAFRDRGHDAWSCDLLPSLRPGPHIVGDARKVLTMGWDIVIAHPPCTYLCYSGSRWLYNADKSRNEQRWRALYDAAAFFRVFLECDARHVAVENPTPHRHAVALIGGHWPTQYVQPWQFGEGEVKRTGLWLRGLPKLEPTNIVEGRAPRVHMLPPGPDRAMLRSLTFQGIADAMAAQWGA